jgi:hypothetical protein
MIRTKISVFLLAVLGIVLSNHSVAYPAESIFEKALRLRETHRQLREIRRQFLLTTKSSKLNEDLRVMSVITGVEKAKAYVHDLEQVIITFGYVKDSCKGNYYMYRIKTLPDSSQYLEEQMKLIERGFEISEPQELVPLINGARVIIEGSKKVCGEALTLLEERTLKYKYSNEERCYASW